MCDCWTEDVWRYIHSMAQTRTRVSDATLSPEDRVRADAVWTKECEAFLCAIVCINEIVSCDRVKGAVIEFLNNADTNFPSCISSADTIFAWTVKLRAAVDRAIDPAKPTKTLEHLSDAFARNKIGKDVWGPMAWRVLHTIALCAKTAPVPNGKPELPRSTRVALKAFVTSVLLLLPCPKCKKHAWEYCKSVSPNIDEYLDTNLLAFQWTVEFHNTVNRRLNATEGHRKPVYSPNDALKLYVTIPSGADFSASFKPERADG